MNSGGKITGWIVGAALGWSITRLLGWAPAACVLFAIGAGLIAGGVGSLIDKFRR